MLRTKRAENYQNARYRYPLNVQFEVDLLVKWNYSTEFLQDHFSQQQMQRYCPDQGFLHQVEQEGGDIQRLDKFVDDSREIVEVDTDGSYDLQQSKIPLLIRNH